MVARSAQLSALVTLLLLLSSASAGASTAMPIPLPTPPMQPATGPGGAEYVFDSVAGTHYGPENRGYWLFEPAGPRPSNGPAIGPFPVVLFLGGCCRTEAGEDLSRTPDAYQDWIDHLVRRGAIVVHVVARLAHAQEDLEAAVRAAMTELETGAHARADWTRFGAAGTSFGGFEITIFAAKAAGNGLPLPKAILAMVPGDVDLLPDLSAIPPPTNVIVLVVSADELPNVERTAKQIWAALTSVSLDHRDFVRVHSDAHGDPPLLADHLTPRANRRDDWAPTNALDWYGTWKLLDALMSCAFVGNWCAYALGNTPEQRFMGRWSDGVPVTELEVTDDPGPQF